MIDYERGIHPQQVPTDVSLITPQQATNQQVTENEPATRVMTDLKSIAPFQIEASASIEDVNSKMIACGVRLLFVHNPQGQLSGLITSKDILGEKPLLFVTNNGGTRDEITVQDIMTPLHKLEAIPFEQVKKAQVAHIVEALKECRRHHMLVLEKSNEGNFVRGLFSITQVGRQLGFEINPTERATSFAQINRALG